MVARWREKLGQFNLDIRHRASTKIRYSDCLSRKNIEDEKTAFVKSIAIAAVQSNTDYCSRGWQIDKLQRVKLRDLQQNDKVVKNEHSWFLNRKETKYGKWKMQHQESYGNIWSSIQIFVSQMGFCIVNTK